MFWLLRLYIRKLGNTDSWQSHMALQSSAHCHLLQEAFPDPPGSVSECPPSYAFASTGNNCLIYVNQTDGK